MNGDMEEDKDNEEKASSEGDESLGGIMKRRWTREGEMTLRVESNVHQHEQR